LSGGTYQTNNTFNNLMASTYMITVQDANGCTSSLSGITLIKAARLVASVSSKTNASGCINDGSITAGKSGGTSPYQYNLNGGAYQTSNIFNNLSAGIYSITLLDSRGCTSSVSNIVISQALPITVSITKTNVSSCNGFADGSITVDKSGGTDPYQFSLNGGAYQISNVFNNLSAGTYSITLLDFRGCASSVSNIVISQALSITVSIAKTNVSGCNGFADGSITVGKSGGTDPYQFSLNGGAYQISNVFNNLSVGIYGVMIKDSRGCTSAISAISIIQTPPLKALIGNKTNISCIGGSDGSLTIGRNGGVFPYKFSLNGSDYQNSNIFGNLSPGTYTATVKDAKGCTASVSVTLANGTVACSAIKSNLTSNIKIKPVLKEDDTVLKLLALPNPSITEFTLIMEGNSNEEVEIIVTDMYGKKVYQTKGSVNQRYIFGKNFSSGIYIIQVMQRKKVQTLKLIKGEG
jgi:large repetitive protein